MRNYGPDLMGMFLSDCGAFGIKTCATLRTIPRARENAHLSFAFSNEKELLDAMGRIGRLGVASECFALNSSLHDLITKANGLSSDIKFAIQLLKAGGVVSGLRLAIGLAIAGRKSLRRVPFSLHVSVDGQTGSEIRLKTFQVKSAVGGHGRRMEPSIPRIIRMQPFTEPTGMLGPNGERWTNVHGIVPHSGAREMLVACDDVFKQHDADMRRLKIVSGYLMCAVGLGSILVEPVLFWPDARELFHDRVLPATYRAGLQMFPANPDARQEVAKIRAELAHAFLTHGAAHFQIGKFYDYQGALRPTSRELLRSIKRLVDPETRINPGNLGFD